MSSVDPLAALAAQLAVTQAADVTLDLGAIAQLLQAQLQLGDILEATVLPPQGGQDLIAILGQTVVAQLPQGVHPGDTLLLQVTGFTGNQIVVRNLGVADPNNPVPVFIPELPVQETGSASSVVLTTIVAQPNVAGQAPAVAQQTPVIIPPPSNGPPVAPPASVFVAASITQPAPAATGTPGEAPAPTAQSGPANSAATAPANVPIPVDVESRLAAARAATAETVLKATGASPVPAAPPTARAPSTPEQAPSGPVDVEARLAATRAASTDRVLQTAQPETRIATSSGRPQGTPSAAKPPPQAPPAAQTLREQILNRPVGIPRTPPLISRASGPASAVQRPGGPSSEQIEAALAARAPATEDLSVPAPAGTGAQGQARPAPAARSDAAQLSAAVASKDPVRILAALHIPASTLTLAAARLVTTAASQVQSALQTLEHVLAQSAPVDPRVDTLQTLVSFLARLDPRNSQTLTAQLSSFVSNVIDGAENKLSALLQALLPRAADGALALPGTNLPAHVSAPAPAHAPIVAEARAAERQIALTADLKTTLLSLTANPPAGSSAQLTQALNQTLTALTAMQFNTLIAAQGDPNSIALSIPMVFFDGGQSANVRISRDAPKNKARRMDADNFHIAFVLDTQTLGTVAIDLETVGRQVKVAVKTDRASAVDQFNTSLGDLRARLEHLRYNVTSTGADMIAPAASQPALTDEAPAIEKTTNVDLQA